MQGALDNRLQLFGEQHDTVTPQRLFLSLLNLAHQTNSAHMAEQQQQGGPGPAPGGGGPGSTARKWVGDDAVVQLLEGPDGDVIINLGGLTLDQGSDGGGGKAGGEEGRRGGSQGDEEVDCR